MKNISRIFGIVAASCILFLSCNGQNRNAEIDLNMGESVEKDVPPNKLGRDFTSIKRKTDSLLGLESLENGYDGTQIRVWLTTDTMYEERLFILTHNKSTWSASEYKISVQFDPNYDSIIGMKNIVFNKTPKSGWKTFEDSLLNTELLTLPDYSIIPGYSLPSDAGGVTIEIGQFRKYRIYSYPHFQYYSNKFPEARKIREIVSYLLKEFE